MLSDERNRLLTEVGPGTKMGALLRRYWQPIAAVAELDDASDQAGAAVRRRPCAVQGSFGQLRPAGTPLPAPQRRSQLRHRRTVRPALQLSRLDVRRDRRLPRAAVRGHRRAADPLPRPDPHPRVSRRGEGRAAVGVSGAGACAAGAELGAVLLGQRLRADRVLDGALQLVPVPGELDRSGAFRVDARQLGAAADGAQRTLCAAPSQAGVRRIRLRPGLSPRARGFRREPASYGRSAVSACGRTRCSPATTSSGACRSTIPTR